MESTATIVFYSSPDYRFERWKNNGNGLTDRKLLCEFHWPQTFVWEGIQNQRAKYCHNVDVIE